MVDEESARVEVELGLGSLFDPPPHLVHAHRCVPHEFRAADVGQRLADHVEVLGLGEDRPHVRNAQEIGGCLLHDPQSIVFLLVVEEALPDVVDDFR